jgi:hypothetical protein
MRNSMHKDGTQRPDAAAEQEDGSHLTRLSLYPGQFPQKNLPGRCSSPARLALPTHTGTRGTKAQGGGPLQSGKMNTIITRPALQVCMFECAWLSRACSPPAARFRP